MLNYDRIDVSEETDINKTGASKECEVCCCWYFVNYSFEFQRNICNRCYNLLMMSVKLSDLDFWNIKDSDYWFIIKLINKKETMNLLQNGDLTEKSGAL